MFSEGAGLHMPFAILLAILNTPLYWLLYSFLFEDVEELLGAIKFWLTPEIFSALRGE